jgi:hypothetical protein
MEVSNFLDFFLISKFKNSFLANEQKKLKYWFQVLFGSQIRIIIFLPKILEIRKFQSKISILLLLECVS